MTFENETKLGNATQESDLYPIGVAIPLTAVYALILFTGLLGNVSTCIVIARNKSMHTATNYYLFSLAVSDLLLLISGLPAEVCHIWNPDIYYFGEAFCILQSFSAETSANATVLTITAFTVERYLAICHPFLSHTMSKLSRAIKYIVAIWITALCLAAPQAIQFGVKYEKKNNTEYSTCTVVTESVFEHSFEISTFLFFVGPMTLISVLYILIAIKLRKSRLLSFQNTKNGRNDSALSRTSRTTAAQNRVIKMLVAVVAAFFICWAPHHAQRLLAVYLSSASTEAQETAITIYITLMHTSGVLYFLSTTINPVLYHIMSNKFREAFKATLLPICGKKGSLEHPKNQYSVLSRCPPSMRNYQRSISDVQGISYANQDQRGSNNQRNFRLSDKPSNNFQLLSRPSQTTVLTNISRLAIDVHHLKDGSIEVDRPNNGKSKKRNDKYINGFFNIFKFTKSNGAGVFSRHNCANSISNSSLQDLDETEFSSSDLVKYMEKINDDLT